MKERNDRASKIPRIPTLQQLVVPPFYIHFLGTLLGEWMRRVDSS